MIIAKCLHNLFNKSTFPIIGNNPFYLVQVDRHVTQEYDVVSLKREGVHHMYPNHMYWYASNPYIQDDFVYQDEYYDPYLEERQMGQFFPPMGPPPSVPGYQPPFSQQPGQGPGAGPPTSPPPSFVPAQTQQQAQAFAVDPGSIRGCLFRYTYVWLRNNQQFWFYPTFVGRRSVSGYRWNGFRWLYFGISLRQIRSFTCV